MSTANSTSIEIRKSLRTDTGLYKIIIKNDGGHTDKKFQLSIVGMVCV